MFFERLTRRFLILTIALAVFYCGYLLPFRSLSYCSSETCTNIPLQTRFMVWLPSFLFFTLFAAVCIKLLLASGHVLVHARKTKVSAIVVIALSTITLAQTTSFLLAHKSVLPLSVYIDQSSDDFSFTTSFLASSLNISLQGIPLSRFESIGFSPSSLTALLFSNSTDVSLETFVYPHPYLDLVGETRGTISDDGSSSIIFDVDDDDYTCLIVFDDQLFELGNGFVLDGSVIDYTLWIDMRLIIPIKKDS
ncbi:hypothetical protein GEMRC1_009124 [Eukaryota sp. GEM-RC1]